MARKETKHCECGCTGVNSQYCSYFRNGHYYSSKSHWIKWNEKQKAAALAKLQKENEKNEQQ